VYAQDGDDVVILYNDGLEDEIYCGKGLDTVFARDGKDDIHEDCEIVERLYIPKPSGTK